MKIKFRGNTLDIQNTNKDNYKTYFYTNWNGYSIEIEKAEDYQHGGYKYKSCLYNPFYPNELLEVRDEKTMKEALQSCFNAIDNDISNISHMVEEYNQWLDLVKEYE